MDIQFDTGGKPNDIHFFQNKIAYNIMKKLVIFDIESAKLIKEIDHEQNFNLLNIPVNKPFIFIGGISKKLFRYSLIGELNKKEIHLPEKAVMLRSCEDILLIGYEKSIGKLKVDSLELEESQIGLQKQMSLLGDIEITKDGKILVGVSKSTSEMIMVDSITLKIFFAGNHEMDHSVKAEKWRNSGVVIYGEHRKFQVCLPSIDQRNAKCRFFEFKQMNYQTKDHTNYLRTFRDSDYAVALSIPTNKLLVIDLKNEFINRVLPISPVSKPLTIHSSKISNLLVILAENPNNKSLNYLVYGFGIPEITDCDSCPFCTSPLKKDCQVCSKSKEVWIEGKCVDCSGTKTSENLKCQEAKYITLVPTKDQYGEQKNQFQVQFQNQNNFLYNLAQEDWSKKFDVNIQGLRKDEFDSKIYFSQGKLRLDINLKSKFKVDRNDLLKQKNKNGWDKKFRQFTGKLEIYPKSREMKIGSNSNKINIHLKNSKISKTIDLINNSRLKILKYLISMVGLLINYSKYFILGSIISALYLSFKSGINIVMETLQCYLMLNQLYFLKLINSDFGPLVNSFFEQIEKDLLFGLPKQQQILRGPSRGKIDFFQLRNYSYRIIPFKLMIFVMLWIFSIYFSYKIQRLRIELTYSKTKHTQ
jgi:hypothetical protein